MVFHPVTYLREVLAKIVHERTAANPFIPVSILKLQLMCRKQNSIVKKQTTTLSRVITSQIHLGSPTIVDGHQS